MTRRFLARFLWLLTMVLVLGATSACRRVADPAVTQLAEARQLAASLRIQLAKAMDASDRAVMAETDEDSVAFARDAARATETVQTEAEALRSRIQNLGFQEEGRLVEEFNGHFSEYQKVDHAVLELAVENSNLKAQRLSFGPIREAADTFGDSLRAIPQASAAKDRCPVDALVARAIIAVREIQVLQAPHIAEADDTSMARLESQMQAMFTSARDAMAKLETMVDPASKGVFTTATQALSRFSTLAEQLVALSRRNTNVRSLAISLRQKPALSAACDATLSALQTALGKEGSSATR